MSREIERQASEATRDPAVDMYLLCRYIRKRRVDARDARVCGIRGSLIGVDKRLDNAPCWQKVSPELPAPRDASCVAGQIVADRCPCARDKARIIGELGSMIRAFLRVARSIVPLLVLLIDFQDRRLRKKSRGFGGLVLVPELKIEFSFWFVLFRGWKQKGFEIWFLFCTISISQILYFGLYIASGFYTVRMVCNREFWWK